MQSNVFRALALTAGTLAAAHVGAQSSILGSSHDLSSLPGANATATTEVCVFCHTPHGANDTASDAPPLWNRSTDTTTTYARYSSLNSATLDGAEAPIGSVSFACLSCHDGTQSRDVVLNLPGGSVSDGNGGLTGGGDIGTGLGTMGSTPLVNVLAVIGTDLTNDHPVSIQYAGGACQGMTLGQSCDPATVVLAGGAGDPDFHPVQSDTINGSPQYWVDTDGYLLTYPTGDPQTGRLATREKTDMLLYARDFAAAGATQPDLGPSVECGSCHDPHEAAARPVQFLRISNANSGVCLACHAK